MALLVRLLPKVIAVKLLHRCMCVCMYKYLRVCVSAWLMVCENRILFKQLCKMKLHWIGIQLNILLHCKNEKREGFDYSSEASLENLEICDTLSNNSKCWVINSVMYGSLERECRTRCNEIFLKIIPTFLFLYLYSAYNNKKDA